jgi:ribosomal protein S18 acetylase RimI-like enzyme
MGMPDMLVKLYDLKEQSSEIKELENKGIYIKRVLAPDRHRVIAYVKDTFDENWASECEGAFSNQPISCFIAVKDKKVIGFACYEVTAKNFFGPTGVSEGYRGYGIGKILLIQCLLAMKEGGYGYAIIGGAEEAINFYKKTVGAIVIKDSVPGLYKSLIEMTG